MVKVSLPEGKLLCENVLTSSRDFITTKSTNARNKIKKFQARLESVYKQMYLSPRDAGIPRKPIGAYDFDVCYKNRRKPVDSTLNLNICKVRARRKTAEWTFSFDVRLFTWYFHFRWFSSLQALDVCWCCWEVIESLISTWLCEFFVFKLCPITRLWWWIIWSNLLTLDVPGRVSSNSSMNRCWYWIEIQSDDWIIHVT